MMDFNLILLLVGLGLLLLVSVFVLLGCFAGLKKELNCAAIAFVVLLLTLLVFGNSSTILDADGSLLKNFIQGIPSSAETIWDCVVAIAQSSVQNGAEIFAEGTKSYAFLYSVVGGVARGVMLIVGTLIMFILSAIGIGTYRLVTRIVAHSKAKRRAEAGIEEPAPETDKVIADNVLVAQSEAGEAEGVMITAGKEPVKKGSSKHRVWAGCLAGLRAVIVIIFLLAPVSGVCSVLDSISPETEKLINESLSGNKQNAASSDTALDIALDFKDAYYDSALGKFVEGSQFFFGDSFSTHLFDSAFTIETENSDIEIREEAIVFIEAVNALEGNANLKELQQAQLENALDALKDSELLVEVMPVVIEVAYYLPLAEDGTSLKDVLFASKQQAAFLQLRQLDWDKNIEVLLDVVKEAYKLGILEDDFNYLTMDAEQLSVTLAELAKSDAVSSLLNIVVKVVAPTADLSDFDWALEYQTIVDIYAEFQKLGITSFENLDVKSLVEEIVNDEVKLQVVVDVVKKATELQLVNKVAYDLAINYVSNIEFITDAGTDVVEAVKDLNKVNWSEDINIYVEAAVKALELVEFEEGLEIKVDYLNLDVEVLHDVVNTLFATESFEKLLPIATNIALGLPKVQELFGEQEVVINTANINWKEDFTTLVNIYGEFQNLEVKDIKDITSDPLTFAKGVFADEAKVAVVDSILAQLADTTLFNDVAVPAVNAIVAKVISEKAPNFDGILDLTKVTEEGWKNDFASLVDIAENVYDICGFDFNLGAINFDEVGGKLGTETIDLLLNLNVLGNNETKNQLVLAALKQFKVFDEETIANLDLSNVVWLADEGYSENANLQAILTIAAKMAKIEGVDLNKLEFDWNTILDKDDTYEYVVDLLDVVVESELVLELVPSLIQKFVVPQIEKFEDEEGTLNSVINGLESEELILEIQKLVDVVKAVVELNVLEVKEGGIQAIDFANTDAMKTIINGIFDSKILEGYEGRVVRILLRASGIFPNLEKGIFEHVDFDQEQAILIKAIDELEVVLQDENFLTFDENGKLVLDKEFYTKEETLNALLGALKALFGEYKVEGSVDGSQIIEVLLPQAFEKFVTNLIPANLEGLMDILNIEDAHPRLLADDVRKILYIAEILVDEKVQSYVQDKDYNFAGAAEALQTVVSTVFALNMVHGSEAELVAWALNFVQETQKLNVEEFTPEHFANVDWDLEVAAINELLADVIKFTNINKISSVNELTKFINEKGYLADDFLEEINYKVIIEIIEDVFGLQLVEELLPVGLEYALKLAKEKDYDLSFLGETMTGELLVEDLMSIVDALEIAVYDIEIFEYKKAGWAGALPELQYVNEILDILVNLNIVQINENDLLTFIAKKFIPKNDFVTATDFAFDGPYDLLADVEVVKEALAVVYDLIHANNMTNIEEVKAFFAEKWYASVDLVTDYNLYGAANLLEVLSDLQLLQQGVFAAMDNVAGLEALTKIGDFSSLTSLSKEELVSDLKTLAEVIRLAVDAGLLQYYEVKDLEPINYEGLAALLEKVGTLNVLNECGNYLAPEIINYVLSQAKGLELNYEFSYADFENVNWAEETVLLGDALVEFGALAEPNNLDSLVDILKFFKNKDFINPAFVTTENVDQVVEILDILVDSKLVAAAVVPAFEYALEVAKKQNIDLTFLSGKLTSEQLYSDLSVVVEIAHNLVDFGAIDYVAEGNIENIDVTYLVNVVALLEELNILTCAQPEWTSLVAVMINSSLKIDTDTSKLVYAKVDYASENELLQEAVSLLGDLLANENIQSVADIKEFINNKYYLDVNTYNENAIATVQSLLAVVAESELLGLHLVDVFEHYVAFAAKKTGLNLSFMYDKFVAEDLQEDILVLAEMLGYATEFGAADLILNGDVEINLDPVIEAVKLLEELNVLNQTNDYIAALVYNVLLPKLGLEKVEVAYFVNVDFANENAILVSALEELKVLLAAEELVSVSDVVEFVKTKEYLNAECFDETYNDEAVDSIARMVKIAVTSDLIKLALPKLLNFAVNKANAAGLELNYPEGVFTGEELAQDVVVLLDEAVRWVKDLDVLDVIVTKKIKANYVGELGTTVRALKDLSILNYKQAKLAAAVTNFVYNKVVKYDGTIDESYFEGVNWAAEFDAVADVLEEVSDIVETFGVHNHLLSIAGIKEFMANAKDLTIYNDEELLDNIGDVFAAMSKSDFVLAELEFAQEYVISFLDSKGINLTSVYSDQEELKEDLVVLSSAIRTIYPSNVIGFLFENKALNQEHFAAFVEAVKDVLALNVLENSKADILDVVFKKLGVRVNKVNLECIDWDAEIEVIGELLYAANDLLVSLEISTLSELKAINVKDYLVINYNTNDILTNINALLDVIVDSQLIEETLLAVSESYLTNESLAGIADIHNIYNNFQEIEADIVNIMAAIEAVIDINLAGIFCEGGNIPYENVEAIEAIITNLFGLNYLNNDGRIAELADKATSIDVSGIDFNKIDLRSDAKQFVKAYESLLPILTDENFFVKNVEDLTNITLSELAYFAKRVYASAVKEAILTAVDTTIVKETKGAIFILLLPIAKYLVPDYYEAIDPERLTVEQLAEDVYAGVDLVKEFADLNFTDITNGVILTDDVKAFVFNAIETACNLNLFEDRVAKVLEVTANRLDGKRIGSYYFDKSEYNFTDVNYEEDAAKIIEILELTFEVLEQENIVTVSDAKAYLANAKANIKALVKSEQKVAKLETIANLVLELSVVKYNILPVYNQLLEEKFAKVLGAELADLAAIYSSSEEMTQDLINGVKVLRDLIDLGAIEVLKGGPIDYDQADLVKTLLNDIASVEYINVYKQNILEFVDGYVSYNLSQIDLSSMDLANDLAIVGEIYEQLIPVLLSEHNPFITLASIKKASILKSDLYALIYDYQSIYPSVVELASEISIAPQIAKIGARLVGSQLTGLLKEVYEIIDVQNATDAEIIEDLLVVAEILRNVEDLDILRKVLYNEDIYVNDNETIAALVANVFELNVVDNNFVELVELALEKVVKLDLTNIDLASIDVENEQAIIVDLVNNGVLTANALGVEKLSEVKPYVKSTLSNVKADVNEAIDLIKNKEVKAAVKALVQTAIAEARKLNGAVCLEIIDLVCESELVEELVLPVYEQKIYTRLSGVLAVIGDLSAYDEAMLAEDLDLLAEIAHDIFDSKLYKVVSTKTLPGEEAVPYLENIIRNAAMLNVVEVKKADILPVAQAVLDKLGLTSYIRKVDKDFDLAKYDLDTVSFKADAEIYASMAPYAYDVLEGLLESGLNTSFLANTEAITALAEIYTISIETTLVKSAAEKFFVAVDKLNAKLPFTINVNEEELLYNISDFLFGLIELGVFSNDGIDLTDSATIEMMKQAVLNSVELPAKLESLINKVCGRAYAYGVVPFNWDIISVKHEAKVYYTLAKQVLSFVQENAASIKALDLSILVKPEVQDDLSEMAKTISESSFVEQLFFPFVEGTFKALTLSYTDGEMTYDATLDDVLNYSLPNFWKVVNAVYQITEFKPSNVNVKSILANLDAVAVIVEVAGTDIMTKDNVAKVIITAFGALTNYDLSEEQIAQLEAIDFSNEVQYSNAFFAELKETYDATGFELTLESIKNPEVIKGLADALEAVLPSETLKVFAHKGVSVVNNRVVAKMLPNVSALITERLGDADYTAEAIIGDLYIFAAVARKAAESNILGNTDNFAVWNFDAIKAMATLCFDTKLAEGRVAEFSEACIENIPGVNELYDSSMVIADWEVEVLTIIAALESLVNDGITSIDAISVEKLSGTTVELICDSVILCSVLVDTINAKLEEQGLDEYYVVTKDSLDKVVNWDAELNAINELVDLMEGVNAGNIELAEIIAECKDIRTNTVLVNDILVSCAGHIVPKLPIVSDYYDESIVVEDWAKELDAIIVAFETLDGKHLDTMEEPIENLTGEIIVACLESVILKEAFVEEFNNNLVAYGLGAYYTVTKEEVETVKTAAEWDKELLSIKALEALLVKINNDTATYTDLAIVKEVVKDTQISKAIFEAVLKSFEISAPEYTIISIAEAIEIASAQGSNEYTTKTYYVEGTVTGLYNTTYGNLYLTDGVDQIGVYGLYTTDGVRYDKMDCKPIDGDNVVVCGVLGNYKGSPQFKNAALIEHDHEHEYVDGKCACGAEDPNYVAPEPKECTIAEALELADGTDVIIKGTVDAVEAWSETYNNMSFTLKDETGSLYVFRCSTKVALGDIITLTGTMGTFNSARQIAQGSTAVITGHDDSYDVVEPEEPVVENEFKLTVDSLSITSNKYESKTATVNGVAFEFVQIGNYGSGLQMRDKNGNTTTLWNTSAFANGIAKIELVFNSAKSTYSNADAVIFSFGDAADALTYTTKLSTVAGEKTYTITPDVATYTFFKLEHDLSYTFYWDSITIYLNSEDETPEPPVHEHVYVEGKCECGAEDPNYIAEITISEAITLGEAQENDTYTEDKYYIEGTVTGLYNATSGYFYITDGTNQILVYGLYNEDGSKKYNEMDVKPVDGDKIIICSTVGKYSDEVQVKDAWLIECNHTHSFVTPYCPCGAENPDYVAPSYPVISVNDAIKLASEQNNNQYTTDKYYIYVEIVEVVDDKLGAMYVSDGLNTIYVNGLYSADGSVRYDSMADQPQVGDVVILYGALGQSKGTAQLDAAWLIEVE